MPKLLCFVLGLLLLCTGGAFAVAIKPVIKHPKQALHIDSTTVEQRHFNTGALQRYAKQKEFKYDDAPDQNASWWDRFWHWVWQAIQNAIDRIRMGKASWLLFRVFLFIIAAGAIALIVFKILGIDIISVLRGESKSIQVPYAESLENIHDINFDGEIENAIANRNYRLAVRLLYLRSLKQLSDAQLIHWQMEKTNTSYVNELTDTEYQQPFSILTTQFEYVWYGDFAVDGQAFQNINTLFIDFKKVLP